MSGPGFFIARARAEEELDWYFNRAPCDLEVGAFDYNQDPGGTRASPSGPPPRQYYAAERARPIRRTLLMLTVRHQRVIQLRFHERAWRGKDFVDWWTPYGRFASVVHRMRPRPPKELTCVEKRKAWKLAKAREWVTEAVAGYVHAKGVWNERKHATSA